jgi:hypothetical protein
MKNPLTLINLNKIDANGMLLLLKSSLFSSKISFLSLSLGHFTKDKLGQTHHPRKKLKSLMTDKIKPIKPTYKAVHKELGKPAVAASVEEKVEMILDKVEERNYLLGKL